MTATWLTLLLWVAQPTAQERPYHLTIDLLDGSTVRGVPTLNELPLRTDDTRRTLRLRDVLFVELPPGEDAIVTLQTGEQLHGRLEFDELKLASLLGPLTVGRRHMRRMTVRVAASTTGWPFDEPEELREFMRRGDGALTLTRGRVVAEDYGAAARWHGPEAYLPVVQEGDFVLEARVDFRTEDEQMGRLTFGVRLEDGRLLQFRLQDGQSDVIGHELLVEDDTEVLWSEPMRTSRREFRGQPFSLKRRGERLSILIGGKVAGSVPSVSTASVAQVFFSLEQYKGYEPLANLAIQSFTLTSLRRQ